jgi:hypothetical protein
MIDVAERRKLFESASVPPWHQNPEGIAEVYGFEAEEVCDCTWSDRLDQNVALIVAMHADYAELLDAYEERDKLLQAVKDLEMLVVESHGPQRHARRIAASVGIESPSVLRKEEVKG